MSEYSDVLFDPRTHTHTSCLNEIQNVDMIILLIGGRFGGQATPEALSTVDVDNLVKSSFDTTILDDAEKLSVTQLEVLKAISFSIPIFAFVDEKVMHDHFVYQKNNDLSEKIIYPSIDKQETAKFIFEFINFLQHRVKGNGLVKFSNIEDIENHLRKQWAALFQRLLKERKEIKNDHNKMFAISEQIEDIKSAVLSMIENSQSRDVARGAIKYRRLIDFITRLNVEDTSIIFYSKVSFEQLLKSAGIEKIANLPREAMGSTALIKGDGTFFELRYPRDFLNQLSIEWQSYKALQDNVRKVIFEAINEMDRSVFALLRYRGEQYFEYIKRFEQKENDANLGEIQNILDSEKDKIT